MPKLLRDACWMADVLNFASFVFWVADNHLSTKSSAYFTFLFHLGASQPFMGMEQAIMEQEQ